MDQCLALAGTSCLRHIPGQTDENSPKYQIACVPHAKCSYPEDMCECDFRYFKGPDNKCLKQKGYNEKCAADDQCDKYPFFSCIGGTCTCDKNHLYDRKNDRCIVTVGSECTIFDFRTITEEHYQVRFYMLHEFLFKLKSSWPYLLVRCVREMNVLKTPRVTHQPQTRIREYATANLDSNWHQTELVDEIGETSVA
jgi:hypothetical protein